ncbi:hypothetical protein Pve01_49760 [Planomonospora venezuelensis]|nr:hypothetical protein Pve01_49760 [Planomonospora venezuelensis]
MTLMCCWRTGERCCVFGKTKTNSFGEKSRVRPSGTSTFLVRIYSVFSEAFIIVALHQWAYDLVPDMADELVLDE